MITDFAAKLDAIIDSVTRKLTDRAQKRFATLVNPIVYKAELEVRLTKDTSAAQKYLPQQAAY